MKTNVKKILQIFENRKDNISKRSFPLDEEKLSSMLSSFYTSGFSLLYITDYQSRQVVYINGDLDLKSKNKEKISLDLLRQSLHAEDLEHVGSCEEMMRYFVLKVADKSEIPNYKSSYQLRRQDGRGKYRMMLSQSIVLSTNNDDLSYILTYESEIEHITFSNNYKISFIDLRGGKSYFDIGDISDFDDPVAAKDILTHREMEILRLLSIGCSSKAIADQLHISYDTVRTHRNNILKKTKMKTLTQVVGQYIKKGLL